MSWCALVKWLQQRRRNVKGVKSASSPLFTCVSSYYIHSNYVFRAADGMHLLRLRIQSVVLA